MTASPYCDFDASASKLSARLREMRESDWTPTPRVKELLQLAQHLEATAEMLREHRWMAVESAFDATPPPEIGIDGWPVEQASRLGSYSAVKLRLRELAGVAREEAECYPNSRAKPEIPYGASVFLHLWYEAENEPPALYDGSVAVCALERVFQKAGIYLSKPRVRGALAEALKEFDASAWPPGMEDILVMHQ